MPPTVTLGDAVRLRPRRGLRVLVLLKAVPDIERLELTDAGRLRRTDHELKLNPYCRRALALAVATARAAEGTCTALSLGPEGAAATLVEAIAAGADDALLASDPGFAGSDTLATSRTLAAALARERPFDLIVAGLNSVDSDTGQVPPQLAELLGLPFLAGVRELDLDDGELRARCEHDDGFLEAKVELPLLLSTAERLCAPSKPEPEAVAAIDPERVRRVDAAALGAGPWGQQGSPTRVGVTRRVHLDRAGRRATGTLGAQASAVAAMLRAPPPPRMPSFPRADPAAGTIAVLCEPERDEWTRALCTYACSLADGGAASVVAVVSADAVERRPSCDGVVEIDGAACAEEFAGAASGWIAAHGPWAVLAPSSSWGREVAARVAAATGSGLTGDAGALESVAGRLLAWKPALGGACMVAVHCDSPMQMATLRPGVVGPAGAARIPRGHEAVQCERRARIRVVAREHRDDIGALASARIVIGLGLGVDPGDYALVEPLRSALGAELAATRKVTDRGWMPRSRQIGITGRSIAPAVYLALGLSGRFTHSAGLAGAGAVIAVNSDPEAPILAGCDLGVVADWREFVPALVDALQR